MGNKNDKKRNLMTSNDLRESFLKYFANKNHEIVPSAPMVVKGDPTLMFTNAGMNQFKDIFLGNNSPSSPRVADSQKCLRVSGKHNDLEEVGHDHYHHTMFEMLGNWSFGDYFKEEAIDFAWDYLTGVLKVDKERLYATVFEGDKADSLDIDQEAFGFWNKYLPGDRVIPSSKKDNFWEMGEMGPCGPCSEIHVDLREDSERQKEPGHLLVNKDHPEVIEIWNLVFIQYNRKANGQLELLPAKHVDTGMGFERLCRVIQNKKSNYDTDIFQPVIQQLANLTGIPYGKGHKTDVAIRVVADHLRAIAFAITDGQLPSNNKAGYVIRRILRRAVRYGYTFLNQKEAFIHALIPVLSKTMGGAYPELKKQQELVINVIKEEENSFLKTLDTGIKLLEQLIERNKKENKDTINGKSAFELYDTYGFPLDLTELIARENNMKVDTTGFGEEMKAQKERSRSATKISTEDWEILRGDDQISFTGYDTLSDEVYLTRYRKVNQKGKEMYQMVFDKTPFYAESGGQVGDKGFLESGGEKIPILDTLKENNLSVHVSEKLPQQADKPYLAVVDKRKRENAARNHSATHLLHHALRKVLGQHVEQKGSLVHPDYLRFDFSHFQKVSEEEIREIESIVNEKIRENLSRVEEREIDLQQALYRGATALFGEKYGKKVRLVQFGEIVELCGGTHVKATGDIGFFKILNEGAISAGIRRIEAITGEKAEEYIQQQLEALKNIQQVLKSKENPVENIQKLLDENQNLQNELEAYKQKEKGEIKEELKKQVQEINGINLIAKKIEMDSVDAMKDLAFQLKREMDNLYLLLGAEINGKANLVLMISDGLVKEKGLHAGNLIKEIAKEIQGGGGGQPFLATAGGKNPSGLPKAIERAIDFVK